MAGPVMIGGAKHGRHRLGIEAELLAADADDVAPRQYARSGNALAVDDGAVGARIGDDVAVRAGPDLGMTPRHLGAHDDHLAPRIAAEDEPGAGDGVFPAIGEADQATGAGGPGGCSRPAYRPIRGGRRRPSSGCCRTGPRRPPGARGRASVILSPCSNGVGSAPSRTPFTRTSATGEATRMAASPVLSNSTIA